MKMIPNKYLPLPSETLNIWSKDLHCCILMTIWVYCHYALYFCKGKLRYHYDFGFRFERAPPERIFLNQLWLTFEVVGNHPGVHYFESKFHMGNFSMLVR